MASPESRKSVASCKKSNMGLRLLFSQAGVPAGSFIKIRSVPATAMTVRGICFRGKIFTTSSQNLSPLMLPLLSDATTNPSAVGIATMRLPRSNPTCWARVMLLEEGISRPPVTKTAVTMIEALGILYSVAENTRSALQRHF